MSPLPLVIFPQLTWSPICTEGTMTLTEFQPGGFKSLETFIY